MPTKSVALCILLLTAACMSASGYSHEDRYLVAVLPFEVKADGAPSVELDSTRTRVIADLLRSNRVRLIERDRVDAMLREQELAQTGLIRNRDAARLGQMLGAEAVVIGEVTDVQSEVDEVRGGSAVVRTLHLTVSLSARLFRADSGEILAFAESSSTEMAREHVVEGRDIRSGRIDVEALFKRAMTDASDDLARRLIEQIPPRRP